MDLTKEQFTSIRPQHLLLRKHIAYYYFHQTFSENFRRTFTYYPNYQVALNVFQSSDINWDKNRRYTLPSTSQKQNAIITFTTQSSREVVMKGRINKIGIIFEPLGFNHFIDRPLREIIKDTITRFDYYDASFEEMTKLVFEAKTIQQKRDLLDAFFLGHYQPFPIEELQLATQQIKNLKTNVTVNDLANEYNISRKTLLRLFNKHLVHNIRGFSNLVKFRNALQLFKQNKGQIKFTQMAYESQFYDQSAFIKNIKSFTGLTPKNLFYRLNDIGGQHTLWTAKP